MLIYYVIMLLKFFFKLGMLSSLVLLGAVVGSFISGILIHKYGERKTSLICDIIGTLVT